MTTSTTDTAALNERVALACGWVHYGCTGCTCTPCVCREWINSIMDQGPCDLPDYCKSLDAMRSAEDTLTESERGAMACRLQHITLNEGLWAAYFASAEDRCRAFLYAKEESLNAQRAGLSEER